MIARLLQLKNYSFLASTSEELSLFEELWTYISEKYLTPGYKVYENITVDPDPLITPAMIFVAGFVAVMIGASVMLFNRRVLGRLVRRLLKREALTPEKALTLSELELGDSKIHKLFINRTTLSRAVRCREEDEHYGIKYEPLPEIDYADRPEGDEGGDPQPKFDRSKDVYYISINTPKANRYKRDGDKDHFYIPDHRRYEAATRFAIKGTNPLTLPILAVSYIILGLIFIQLYPSLLAVFDAAITTFKGM